MWWFLTREVLRLRGEINRQAPWDVMVDLFFYRDPEEVKIWVKTLVIWLKTFFLIKRVKKKNKLLLQVKIVTHNPMLQMPIIMMMVHQLCHLQKTLQVIKITGVHLLIAGLQRLLELLLTQMIGTHQQLQSTLLQVAGDLIKSLFFLRTMKPNTRIKITLLQTQQHQH